jgi:hypothetical protein
MAKKDRAPAAAPAAAAGGTPQIRLSDHPRATAGVRRARAWAGLLGFFAVLLLARRAGAPGFDAVARALLGGVAAHFLVWACAVAFWRRLVLAELDAARRRVLGPGA